jgi:hypothetical protein
MFRCGNSPGVSDDLERQPLIGAAESLQRHDDANRIHGERDAVPASIPGRIVLTNATGDLWPRRKPLEIRSDKSRLPTVSRVILERLRYHRRGSLHAR